MTSLPLFGIDALFPIAAPGDTDRAKRLSQYFTPPRLAARIAEWAGVRGLRVLEPSAGGGALRRACIDAGAEDVDCVEIDPRYIDSLRDERLGLVLSGSFLDLRPSDWPDYVTGWDVGVLNPPYEKGLDGAFLAHVLLFAPRAVALVRLAALAGKDRGADLWEHVEITRLVILSTRPEFEGELAAGGAKSDFVVVEYQRRDPSRPRPLVAVEHWAGAWS
ncbi:MAG: hypothetical protein WC211_00705 [Dehalococcoidia bacterium]